MNAFSRRSLIVGLVAGLLGASAAAEEQPPIASGARVRIMAPTVAEGRLIGTLTRIDATTLTVRRENGYPVEVPRAAITRIELSHGRSHKGRGAWMGAAIGLAAAVALGLSTDDNDFIGPDAVTAAAAVVGVPLGMLIGYAVTPGERWVVTSPDRFRMAVAPARGGGVGASLSFRF